MINYWCETATFVNLIGWKLCSAKLSERIENCHITVEDPYSALKCSALWTEYYPTTSAVQELQVTVSQAIAKTGHFHQVDMSCSRWISTQIGDGWGIPGVVCFCVLAHLEYAKY
jgi:hypothetical protein